MNSATATNRFRGRAGRRIATALVVAAALGLGATACGEGSGAAGAAGSSGSAAASASTRPTSGSSADHSGSQGQNGDTSAKASSAAKTGSGSASTGGGGVAHAGNHRTLVGKLEYLAPGKLIVKPEGGGTDQAFFVANATKILGAAAICADNTDGRVTIGEDGYGTSKCTVDQLEKAAKSGSVTVRVTMDTKSGAAETVEEKYHP
ncbi:hypothetical protein OHT20_20340 [Streptomyces caniferus]|uniref:Lipoprotein n=1 Tax=Streptomyces caniferus TaxID=285557 RepID=A0ABZ1VMA3_9ACTN|nr:hypothetical protein [Streptomyces caniferus]